MTIFLDSPRYEWGVFGFLTTPEVGRWVVRLASVASLITLLFALGIYIRGHHEPILPAQMLFLIASAWIGVFGLFRLFATLTMKIFEALAGHVEENIPVLARPVHFMVRAYWIVFEVFIPASFAWLMISANCIPFGLLKLDT